MSRTRFGVLSPRSRSQLGQRSKSSLSNNSETTEANQRLTKFHRKIEHNEKVCHAQEFGSYTQIQSRNQVRGQIMPKIMPQYFVATVKKRLRRTYPSILRAV